MTESVATRHDHPVKGLAGNGVTISSIVVALLSSIDLVLTPSLGTFVHVAAVFVLAITVVILQITIRRQEFRIAMLHDIIARATFIRDRPQ